MKYATLAILILGGGIVGIFAQEPAAPKAEPAPAAKTAPAPSKEIPSEAPVPPELTGKTRFEGIIINMQGALAGATYFSVEIEKWSTPEEIKEAKQSLASGGTQGLLEKVWDAKQIGYLKVRNSMGKPIHYARAIPVPGGYIVRLLADTPIASHGTISANYPFCFLEMVVPADGMKGHGQLIGMAKFYFDETGAMQVAAYGTMPVRLEEVVIKQPKK